MREEIGNLVYPVLRHGLRLKEALERGEGNKHDLATEQSSLKGLLKTAAEAQRWPVFSGDGDQFLGVRYALVCWLDEVFIESPWGDRWNERKLEEALYKHNERAYRFWEQARVAESRTDNDALEAFYLCVMLGFRGDLRDRTEKLEDWRKSAESQLNQGREVAFALPAGLPPPRNAPPLTGRSRLHRAFAILGVVLIPWIVVVSFLLNELFFRNK
jgi:type VI secretion system protein ImpK